MKKITEPAKLKITAHFENAEDDCSIVQIQSYQLTGSWVRYFLSEGAKSVEITNFEE